MEGDKTIGALIVGNQRRYQTYQATFRRIFGRNLKDFWDKIFGFDLSGFDDWLVSDDDESIRDAVKKRYGDEAVALIEKLNSGT